MGYIGQAPTKVPLTSADITDGTIALADMAANSVDSDQYVDGSIDAVHLSANSVDSDAYVDGSIDTIHVGDDQITGAKLNPALVSGDIIYADGTDTINRLAKPGTPAGEVLTFATSASAPSWVAAGGGGTKQVVQVNGAGYSATTSASYANMPGASVAITTTGGDVLVQFHTGAHLTSTGRYGYIAIRKDAGTDDRPILFIKSTGTAGANNSINGMTQFLYTSLVAGSYTFYGRWRLDYASGYLNNSSSPVMMTAMELA